MTPNPALFTPLLIISLAIFAWGCWQRLNLISLGKPEDRFDRIGQRFGEMLRYAFGQQRVMAKPFGINHAVIFWSFLLLMIANGEFLLNGIFPSLSLHSVVPQSIYLPLLFILDVVSLLALAAILAAVVRRLLAPPYPEARTLEAFFILSLIAVLMLAYFTINGARIAAGEFAGQEAYLPISRLFARLISPESVVSIYGIGWWTHAVALLLFICYLPNSKHMHILTAIPNCFFRHLEKPNTQPQEEFVRGTTFGVDRVDRFTWKDLLDGFACTECGRCQIACPAGITGKPLNPRGIIHDIKVNLLNNGSQIKAGNSPGTSLIGEAAEGTISEDALWSCTTCGACLEACPVFIEQMPKIIQMRRYLVETEARFPEELLNLFENMEGRSNPWGIAPTERSKWCAQMEVKPFVKGETEYLLYVGCAGSFDSRNKQVTVALAQLLDKAGVSWGILGKEEKCCGDSVRRLGNEFVFDRMARENVALLKEKGVVKVIAQCPHCFSTLKNDYRQYGIELEVIHHSELLQQLVARELLTPSVASGASLGAVTYHDSCYLGRHNDVYDAPRELVASATGRMPEEMERNRENAFCCGAGGGRMWMEEHLGERINHHRVREALDQQPDTICVACPYCLTMFEDGLKDVASDGVKVRDVAEVIAEAVLR